MHSRGHLPEKPRIVPSKSTPPGFVSYATEVASRRVPQASLPTGNSGLAHVGDDSHLYLGNPEYFCANRVHLVHAYWDIPKGIKNQLTMCQERLACGYAYRYNCSIMDISSILQGIMDARDWTQEELADSIPTTQSNISRWLGGREPRGRNMERIRQLALESGVLQREPVTSNQAPLMGRVGAGAVIDVEFEQAPPDGYDTVELPFSFPDPILAFEITGDSMFPAYEPGEIIICLRDQVRATDHYLGERVVVRLTTGERYLKRLARGFSKGTYNLESWNARTIEDVRVEWVGEIVAAVNPSAVRRIERRHRQAIKNRKPVSIGRPKH